MNAENNQAANAPKKSGPLSTIALIAFAIVAGILVQESTSMPESAVKWGKDLQVAMAASGAESKPILLNFTSRGCKYCVQMEKEVIVQDDIKSTIEKYIPVKLDAFDNKEASARYDIDALPAYVIVDANGRKLGMVDGFQPASRFKEFLDKGLALAQTKTQ
ncbi:MAG TPA: thioredoxin family protein [Phycisphaerae bacterium]|nr:thioredoxin family protein [Phycisphaerae bacterium]